MHTYRQTTSQSTSQSASKPVGQTDRQTTNPIYRQTDRQTDRQLAHQSIANQSGRHTYRQTDRQTGRQAGRQTANNTTSQPVSQPAGQPANQSDKETDRQTDNQPVRQPANQIDRQSQPASQSVTKPTKQPATPTAGINRKIYVPSGSDEHQPTPDELYQILLLSGCAHQKECSVQKVIENRNEQNLTRKTRQLARGLQMLTTQNITERGCSLLQVPGAFISLSEVLRVCQSVCLSVDLSQVTMEVNRDPVFFPKEPFEL